MISSAISIHHSPKPHRVIPAISPTPEAISPIPGRPFAANIAGASPPNSNMPSAPVPIGPRASQLDAAIFSWGSLCRAMRSSRMVRMLNATGREKAQST
ncbi:hypothetical protein D3C78_1359970 [compost metagenome]